ncbi:MAG: hypothetical protein QM702_00105 [Rubrivivax sp.]
MSAQHTPGSWHVGGDFGAIVYDSQGWAVADAKTSHGRHDPQGAATRNARLIAAAPDLLAALQALMSDPHLDEDEDSKVTICWEDVRAARAAIAKATGVQP